MGSLCDEVCSLIKKLGGLTAPEIAEAMGRSQIAIRRDLQRLRDQGRIMSRTERRQETGGRPARVWEAV